MKKTILALTAATLAALSGCAAHSSSGADDQYGTTVASAHQCATCTAHGISGKDGFEWFKGLTTGKGRWVCHKTGPDNKPMELVVVYKTVSNGSAVCETLFPGSPEEMITMYHLDGDRLTATHYCAMGNQPRMQAVLCACEPKAKTCNFNFLDGTNMNAATDSFMGKQDYIFNSDDTLTIKWHHLGPGGKDAPDTFGGTFTRVK